MSLGPPQRKPGELRPHVAGCVRGTQRGQPAVVQVEWLVDWGSDVAAVWQSVSKNFDRMRIAASASPTTGQGAIGVYIGLEIEFRVDSRSDARGGLQPERALPFRARCDIHP